MTANSAAWLNKIQHCRRHCRCLCRRLPTCDVVLVAAEVLRLCLGPKAAVAVHNHLPYHLQQPGGVERDSRSCAAAMRHAGAVQLAGRPTHLVVLHGVLLRCRRSKGGCCAATALVRFHKTRCIWCMRQRQQGRGSRCCVIQLLKPGPALEAPPSRCLCPAAQVLGGQSASLLLPSIALAGCSAHPCATKSTITGPAVAVVGCPTKANAVLGL